MDETCLPRNECNTLKKRVRGKASVTDVDQVPEKAGFEIDRSVQYSKLCLGCTTCIVV